MPSVNGAIRILLPHSIDEAMLPYRELRLELALITSIAAFFAVAIGVLMARGVTRPVLQWVSAAQRITRSDYSVQLELRSNDELGLLARTLESMRESIANVKGNSPPGYIR
ncbi:MAG: nitrogen fixation/metabolism regulation signal transduction histidine kinase [Gammaproteobacteria bacterium]|jgi:nitrogen fixation/metabolism regulation signal transduction histidine kinase